MLSNFIGVGLVIGMTWNYIAKLDEDFICIPCMQRVRQWWVIEKVFAGKSPGVISRPSGWLENLQEPTLFCCCAASAVWRFFFEKYKPKWRCFGPVEKKKSKVRNWYRIIGYYGYWYDMYESYDCNLLMNIIFHYWWIELLNFKSVINN